MPVSCSLTSDVRLGNCCTIDIEDRILRACGQGTRIITEGPNSHGHIARCNIKVDKQSYYSGLSN